MVGRISGIGIDVGCREGYKKNRGNIEGWIRNERVIRIRCVRDWVRMD